MQIKITFTSEKEINLPTAYRHAQQSLIYNVLHSCPGYSLALHNHGTSELTTGFKLFTFGSLEGRYTKVGKRLIFDGRVSFEIRCYDPFMAQLLVSGLSEGEKDFELSISPVDGDFRKLVTLFKNTYVNARYGSFTLEGNPKVIYNVGLGNKTSQGFGMLEVL